MKAVVEIRFQKPANMPNKNQAYVIALDTHPHFGEVHLDTSPDAILDALTTGLVSVVLHLEEKPQIKKGKLMDNVIKRLNEMYVDIGTELSKPTIDNDGNITEEK